jgi:site-specific DNA recombinase
VIRYARWAAVSTAEQAKKVSIKDQLDKGLEAGVQYGWVETHAPFVVPGQSRTKFISLYHAEKEIPELRNMIECASRGEFDLIYVYDLNRFRSLMLQIFEVFCDFGVQIFNGAAPHTPVEPEAYTPEVQNARRQHIKLGDIISEEESNRLQKQNRDKMPKRVTEKGLHAGIGKPPYGYRKPRGFEKDPDAVLEPNPETAPIVHKIKDMLFEGKSINTIKDELNQKGIPSPTGKVWRHDSVGYILRNSFYSGTTVFGVTRRQRDRRSGTVKKVRGLNPQTGKGRHEPLWDEKMQAKIRMELSRRGKDHAGRRTRTLSHLLYCHCEQRMWVRYEKFYSDKGEIVWSCRTRKGGHAHIKDSLAKEKFTAAFIEELKKESGVDIPEPADTRNLLEAKIKELEKKQRRWADGFEKGDIDSQEYAERTKVIRDQIADVKKEIDGMVETSLLISEKQDGLKAILEIIEELPDYIRDGDPVEVNSILRSLMNRAIVTEAGEVEIKIF